MRRGKITNEAIHESVGESVTRHDARHVCGELPSCPSIVTVIPYRRNCRVGGACANGNELTRLGI